jgi:aromatic-L-amino-acid/L-tryptophan decarboxylase
MQDTLREPVLESTSACAAESEATLDPVDWSAFGVQSHQMLDDMLDHIQNIRKRPVWQPIPDAVRERFRDRVPGAPTELAAVHEEFMRYILPFTALNSHPGFMGWVQGAGTPVGMLAEMLAAGLNANLGGRDQIPIEVERQLVQWMCETFGFPAGATGLFVTGASVANLMAVVIARDVAFGYDVRRVGILAEKQQLTAYASTAVHTCVTKAIDLVGVGSDALRLVPTDRRRRIDLAALIDAIKRDRASGLKPFLIVGTAGTVDTGAIDDLIGLSDVARRENLWFHVDGACGALAKLAPELAPKLAGIERADSLAFDFHKWGQVPYDAGFLLVRNGDLHRNAFSAPSAYLRRETGGLSAGARWPCDYGPDLSRGFRALKTWFTLKVLGTAAIGAAISRSCDLARYLEQRIQLSPELQLMAPLELNIVCFRYRADRSDEVNARIVVALQESGLVAPSTTILDGRLAIRAAIVNHRTTRAEIDTLVDNTLALGAKARKNAVAAASETQPILDPMMPGRAKWQAQLEELDKQLESDSTSVELRFRRASLLMELGRFPEARDDYMKGLAREPTHREALNNLGRILEATRYRKAARTAFRQAVACHPNDPASHVNFGNFLLEESQRLELNGRDQEALQSKREARTHFERALGAAPTLEIAHEGLSYVLGDLGDQAGAARHRRAAFENRYVIPFPYRGESAAIPVLLLMTPAGGNVPLQAFLDDRIFQIFVVIPEFYDRKTPLPPHELVLNGIGDAESSRGALAAAHSLLALTTAPVINNPAAVLMTARSNNADRLSHIPGVAAPKIITLSREQLSGPEAAARLASYGFQFPLLLRAPGFHTGQNFVFVENPEALPARMAGLPGAHLLAIQYLDARRADGKARKYRAMMIDGKLYPLHVAISSHWKIHYFTAEMAENPAHRAEDAAFLQDMAAVLGSTAMAALENIQATLGLDYAGIDFGLNAKGEILLFEANAIMNVIRPESDERWNYRHPAYQRIREGVQQMLLRRIHGSVQESTRSKDLCGQKMVGEKCRVESIHMQ